MQKAVSEGEKAGFHSVSAYGCSAFFNGCSACGSVFRSVWHIAHLSDNVAVPQWRISERCWCRLVEIVKRVLIECCKRRSKDSVIFTMRLTASVIVPNSKSRFSIGRFDGSVAVDTVIEVDCVGMNFPFVLGLWWRRPGTASQALYLCARMRCTCLHSEPFTCKFKNIWCLLQCPFEAWWIAASSRYLSMSSYCCWKRSSTRSWFR